MNVEQVKKVIKYAIDAGDNILLEGVHGIGKSSIVREFANENGYHLEELYLSHQEVGDLIGIPKTIELDGQTITVWSKPIWLQRIEKAAEKNIPSILFLDELNRAPLDVRQCALPLALDGKIHEHSLPVVNGKRTFVIAAINPYNDNQMYQVDELDSALLDRFLHLKLEVDVKNWLSWAKKNNVEEVVINFISEFPDRLYYIPNEGKGATPRAWERVSNFIKTNVPDDLIFEIFKGKLGIEVASQFYHYYKSFSTILSKTQIYEFIEEKSKNITDFKLLVNEFVENFNLQKVESIRKSELCEQIVDDYKNSKDIRFLFDLLVFLYSIEIEISTAFLKTLKNENENIFNDLVKIDDKINNKELLKRIARHSV